MGEKIEHPWEYTQIIQFATPKNKIDYSTKEGQQVFTKVCAQIFGKIPKIIDRLSVGGGWQVNSHNILIVEGSVLISILLQRPKRV